MMQGMTRSLASLGRVLGSLAITVSLLAGAAACAAGKAKVPAGTAQPDTWLFERGNEALNKKKWMTAREYFQTIVETYPQSPHRADAKLGVGDSLLGEGTAAAQIQAIQEFREFISFFPTHARADYAQYKLAMAHYYQMAKPERDQTETREAIREFDVFFERYPNSKLRPEAEKYDRETRDRLSESEYRVGLFYHRARWYPGAIDRFQQVLKTDPKFTNRDAVYFYLSEALVKMNRPAEAVPQLTKLVEEFEVSEFLVGAQKLLGEIKNAPVQPATTPKADGDKPKDGEKPKPAAEKPKPAAEKPKQDPAVGVKPKTNP
jgi:outer membrane protein assembly factor BamD